MADDWSERSRFAAGLALCTVVPLAATPLLASGVGRGTAEVLGAFVVVAYAGHVAVTGWLWTVADVRRLVRDRPRRLVAVPLSLLATGCVVPSVASGPAFGWLLTGFFAWQFTHFQRQNVGLLAAIAKRWDAAPLAVGEARIVAICGWCATTALVARPTLLGLPRHALPGLLVRPALCAAEAGFTACAVVGAVTAYRSRRPPPVRAAHLAAVLFVAPVFLFATPGAAVTGMVVAHGLQYLWAVGWRSAASRRTCHEPRAGWRTAGPIVALAVAGGSALAAMSELHAPDGFARLGYGAYFGIVMGHFAIDAVVWRQPAPRRTSPKAWPLLPSPALGGP